MADDPVDRTVQGTPAGRTPVLIIGLGNPILGDDGIGWVVADRLKRHLGLPAGSGSRFDPEPAVSGNGEIEIDRLSIGGLSLMERLVGYERVILIDSIRTGKAPPGKVWRFSLSELEDPSGGHTTAAHDTSLARALEVGRALGAELPEDAAIHVVAVEAEEMLDFSETLSPPVSAAVPEAVNAVLGLLATA